ncbi:hypothetical protein LTR36_004740 [Oleoguttula mirabilis]|uniref:N-acetyltransferase domain-containing protein n=1 Tax=Oleoguttula mirabilis TaxID=1507867 RepID=A0AAV9JGM6_9PEZI|nr:hypothetical protein LTR36_004740 [Oleoguttula mirabilis]
MSPPDITTVPSSSIPAQPWWPGLHSTIIAAFHRQDTQVFPPTWTRLHSDPATGAEGLATELGPRGQLVVILEDGKPIACSGVLPFRGEDWTRSVRGVDCEADYGELTNSNLYPQAMKVKEVIADWEICCFCVHPSRRGRGLARLLLETLTNTIKPQGAVTLIANYAIDEKGGFWPRMGFTQPIGSGSVLSKGFTITPGMEGLRDDVHFRMSAKTVD